MTEIYDLHTHIIPGIDDGSSDIEESLRLLSEEKIQGVSRIVLTPHFYAQKESVERYLEKRRERYETLRDAVEGQGLPELKLAAEVYFFHGMGQAEVLRKLCLTDTDYVFVEMPFAQWDAEVYIEIRNIIEKLKLKVMIVHIERYFPYQKDKSIWREVFSLPVVPQINAGAFSDFRERQIAKKMIKKDYPIVLGSDCHNMRHRKPNLKEGRDYIRTKFGEDYLLELDQRSEAVWMGR